MSDVDLDEGTDLSVDDDSAGEFLDFLGEAVGGDPAEEIGDGDDADDGSVEGDDSEDEPEVAARRVANEPEDEDEEPEAPAKDKGRERLASKLAAKEREVTNLSRRLKELEAKVNGEGNQPEPELFDDRITWVRGQIARGLGLKADHPRVAEELQELIDDVVFKDVSPDLLKDNETLRNQIEERKRTAAVRREQIALDRRLAEIERREAEAQKLQQEAGVRSQLTGYLGQRADELPYLTANPDAEPVDLVFQALQIKWESGEDLRDPEVARAAVQDITDRLEAHYSSVAERLAGVRERIKSTTSRLDKPGAKRQDGAAKVSKRRVGGATVTSAGGAGGRGSVPTTARSQESEEETFDEFLNKGLSERARAARRTRR